MFSSDSFVNDGYSIKDASALVGLSASSLRNLESYFHIIIERNPSGQRMYSNDAVNLFKKIKMLTNKGLQYAEIKNQLASDIEAYCRSISSRVEIVDDYRSPEAKNFDLVIKPYSDRINALEKSSIALTNRIIELERSNASLEERDKLHDVVVSSKEEVIASLKAQLEELSNKKRWWKIWS